jgi:hypothetical protein
MVRLLTNMVGLERRRNHRLDAVFFGARRKQHLRKSRRKAGSSFTPSNDQ